MARVSSAITPLSLSPRRSAVPLPDNRYPAGQAANHRDHPTVLEQATFGTTFSLQLFFAAAQGAAVVVNHRNNNGAAGNAESGDAYQNLL